MTDMTRIKPTAARSVIATVAAAATALALMTASAMPARANTGTDNMAKAIAALAAIGIIGSAFNNTKRQDQVVAPRRHDHRDVNDRGIRYNRDDRYDRRDQSRVLPQECAVEVRRHRHSKTLYVKRCLRRNGINRHLPQQCATRVYLRNRPMTAYSERCLQGAGFRTEDTRRRRRY